MASAHSYRKKDAEERGKSDKRTPMCGPGQPCDLRDITDASCPSPHTSMNFLQEQASSFLV
jgi:hypothetical protein